MKTTLTNPTPAEIDAAVANFARHIKCLNVSQAERDALILAYANGFQARTKNHDNPPPNLLYHRRRLRRT